MWGDFALAFAISVDSVVLGWVVIMFQSRCLVDDDSAEVSDMPAETSENYV